MLSLLRVPVQSLVRELRSRKPHGATKLKKKNKVGQILPPSGLKTFILSKSMQTQAPDRGCLSPGPPSGSTGRTTDPRGQEAAKSVKCALKITFIYLQLTTDSSTRPPVPQTFTGTRYARGIWHLQGRGVLGPQAGPRCPGEMREGTTLWS